VAYDPIALTQATRGMRLRGESPHLLIGAAALARTIRAVLLLLANDL
jgi:hypothetical protein